MRRARRRFDLTAYLLAVLVALTLIAGHVHGAGNVLPQSVIALAAAVFLDAVLRPAALPRRSLPTGAIISGLIVALLLPEGSAWYVPLVAAALAIGSKHLLRWKGGNVFNPAALGVAASVVLFSSQLKYDHADYLEAAPRLYYAESHLRMEDWSFVWLGGHGWIGSTSAVAVIALGAVLVHRMKRGGLVGGFLLTYVALFAGFALATGQDLATRLALEVFATGAPFFALFMLTDPATSPRSPRGRIGYGVFVAALSFAFRLIASPVQFLLYALLAANATLSLHGARSRRRATTTVAA